MVYTLRLLLLFTIIFIVQKTLLYTVPLILAVINIEALNHGTSVSVINVRNWHAFWQWC